MVFFRLPMVFACLGYSFIQFITVDIALANTSLFTTVSLWFVAFCYVFAVFCYVLCCALLCFVSRGYLQGVFLMNLNTQLVLSVLVN